MSTIPSPEPLYEHSLDRWQWPGFVIGGILLIVSAIGGVFSPREFFAGYLLGYLFWFGITLGSLSILMMQYLTGGAWGVVTRRVYEAASRTLPWVALAFIPIIFGIPFLYPWSNPQLVHSDEILSHRSVYMNSFMFIARAIAYFVIWGLLAYFMNRWSAIEDQEGGQRKRMERLSAPGLILYVFTITFASVDWAESLSAHWYSTMWGFLFVAVQGLSAMAFSILVLALLSRTRPMSEILRPSHFHDLGKLLLMFVMLWAYFEFSQLLIVWSGNLTGEIPWYMPRFATSWAGVGGALFLLQFAIPFLLLLSRPLKQNPYALSTVVGILLAGRFIDLYWVVEPEIHRNGATLHWLTITLPLALGGLWLALFARQLHRRPLLPLRAPDLEQALHHGSR